MGLECHLVIFARAPRLGGVKRRLAADIGDLAAWRFYRRTLTDIARRLGHDPRWRCWLAVTPDCDATRSRLWPSGIPRLPQGRGDLGRRMARPLQRLPPGPVVIVGSDIPGVRPAHIARAFAMLGTHDAVFGPAPDGGYWLVGFRRRPFRPDPFAGVRWSGPHALADTLANLDARVRVAMVDTLEDVDDLGAWARWRDERGGATPI